jgi:hypothetical protein
VELQLRVEPVSVLAAHVYWSKNGIGLPTVAIKIGSVLLVSAGLCPHLGRLRGFFSVSVGRVALLFGVLICGLVGADPLGWLNDT